MVLIICLLMVGVLLLGSEVILPSGLIGTVGGVCIISGICVAYTRYGPFAGIIAGVGSLVAVVLVIVIELKLLPRTRVGKKMFNNAASAGKAVNTGAATAPELIGKRGTAATTFAPTGLAEIDGHQYEASSLDGLLNRGDPLVVAGRDSYKLLVKKAPADVSSA
jgi:membrane-bound ClpP family serine protease